MSESQTPATIPADLEPATERRGMSATYSPDDNKLRLYSVGRLASDDYERVRAAGFRWAPKQELWVAPAWSPEREDLLLSLCGEVGDEDTSLTERAEQRAERFDQYSENRAADAESARKAVASIADGIPLGQPILVGHHSERRARRDAEKIQNGMARAVKMWDLSKYWTDRAAAAKAHAKYKELPGVRYRRIKGLEADARKSESHEKVERMLLRFWTDPTFWKDRQPLTLERARKYTTADRFGHMPCVLDERFKDQPYPRYWSAADVLKPDGERPESCPAWTLEQCIERARTYYGACIARAERWSKHYANRLAYERAMLEESGGLAGAGFDYQPGGRVLRRNEWFPVLKVNRRGGVVNSVTVSGHFARTITVDEIKDYRPPAEGDGAKAKKALDKGPMCNYPGEGFRHMTREEWEKRQFSDWPKAMQHKATETHGKHRTRATKGDKWATVAVYLTDEKRKDPPKPDGAGSVVFERQREVPEIRPQPAPAEPDATAESMEAMRASLKAGVQVVSAPQLFPTPPDLAARVIEAAEIFDGASVLEPSAGTGNLLRALFDGPAVPGTVVAVEVNAELCTRLRAGFPVSAVSVRGLDFLAHGMVDIGYFDRIVMNPPFENADDIKHIRHALAFLKPGGILVALCAAGPRQREAFVGSPSIGVGVDSLEWTDLEPGAFKASGTNVNAAMVVIRKA